MNPRSGAFISYARSDGQAFADALRARLQRDVPDIRIWQDRTELEGGLGWWTQIEEALERVEFLIVVMTPAVLESDITRKEWRAARQNGVCVYPVKGTGFDVGDVRLPRWMRKVQIYDLDFQWEAFVAHLRRGCTASRVPFMAPPLPAHFVQRPQEFNRLRSLLLDGERGEPIAITSALIGAGGFGKTTLATALCHDDDIAAAFDDGILWVTLGEKPDLQAELTRLYAALTGERPGFVNTDDAAQALAEKLENKNCLLVIDDAWSVSHTKPFLRGGAGCARLITTRQADVASEMSRVDVDEMSTSEAVALLLARIPERPKSIESFRRLAQRLREWPLLLKLTGAAMCGRIDRGDSVDGALDYVNKALEKRGITAFDPRRTSEAGSAVQSTLDLSFHVLDETDQHRCLELSIFPEDTEIPLAVVSELWGLDQFDTEEGLSRLHGASLLDFDLRTASIRLHDVIREYAAQRLGSQSTVTHARLLRAWPDRYDLPHEYAWSWLGHHLAGAAAQTELAQLLKDPNWLALKLEKTDVHRLLSEFHYAPPIADLEQLRHAIRLSSHILARDKSQFASQLLGRLPRDHNALADKLIQLMSKGRLCWLQPLAVSLAGPGGPLLRIFECHAVPTSLQITPNGDCVIAACSDESVIAWNVESGKVLWNIRDTGTLSVPLADGGRGAALAVLANGNVLLGTSQGVSLWNPLEDRKPRDLLSINEGVAHIAVNRENSIALIACNRGTLTVFDPQALKLIRRFKGRARHIGGMAMCPDGRFAITGGYDKSVRLWDVESGDLEETLDPLHEGFVYSIAIAEDGSIALSASGDRSIRVWDLTNKKLSKVLLGHQHRVYTVAISRDAKRALSGSHDRTIKLWDLETGAVTRTFTGHSDSVYLTAFTPNERYAISASRDRTIRVWELSAGHERGPTQQHDGPINAVAIDEMGRAFTAGQDRVLRVWDIESATVVGAMRGHHEVVSSLVIDRIRDRVMSGSHDGTLIAWDRSTGELLQRFERRLDSISALALDGERLLSGSLDGDVAVWDLERGELKRRWLAHRRSITFVGATASGRNAVTAASDGLMQIWDVDTSKCLHSIPAHHDGVTAAGISEDGDLMVSGGTDGTLRVWSLRSCEMLRETTGHSGKIRTLRVYRRGKLIVSGGYDGFLRVWDLETLKLKASFAADSAITAADMKAGLNKIIAGDAQGGLAFLAFAAQ
jgi:WD40 repeat protein